MYTNLFIEIDKTYTSDHGQKAPLLSSFSYLLKRKISLTLPKIFLKILTTLETTLLLASLLLKTLPRAIVSF